MRNFAWLPAFLAAGLALVSVRPALAQTFDDVGTRAQGMGGAFVAVADDATAGWWNPAGIATGAYFNLIFEKGRLDGPKVLPEDNPVARVAPGGFALALPSLGVSYYRLRISEIRATTGAPAEDRQQLGDLVHTRAINQFGSTIAQSLGNYLTVGTTVKLVRAGSASAPYVAGTDDPYHVAGDLDVPLDSHGDLDVGVMGKLSHLRLGLTMRNLFEPDFGTGADRFTIERQARAGAAFLSTAHGTLAGLTLSTDFDLTRQATPFGESRRFATGGEAMFFGRRLAVRGGLSENTLDDHGWTKTTGISVAPINGLFIEGAKTFGPDGLGRGWSSTVRVSF